MTKIRIRFYTRILAYKPSPTWQAEQNIWSNPIILITKEHSDKSEFCVVDNTELN